MRLALEVKNLSKKYSTFSRPSDIVIEWLTGKKRHRDVWVLKDINIGIAKGEVVGVLGRNGAGKSTLLKMISGVVQPTEGSVSTQGRVSAILELGTGFHPQLTGRENAISGAICLGLNHEQALEKLGWIIEFSELGDVIDQPFYTYSSGMRGRLTFATAVSIDPEIFIVDEALATGDAAFARKCIARIREICQSGVTGLFVSHSTFQILQLCSRCVWIEAGRVKMDGPTLEVVRAYEHWMHALGSELLRASHGANQETFSHFRKGPYKINAIQLLDKDQKEVESVKFWEPLTIRVEYERIEPGPAESVGFAAAITRQSDYVNVCMLNTTEPHSDEELFSYNEAGFRKKSNRGVLQATIDPVQLTPDKYLLSFGILPNEPGAPDFYEYHHLAKSFSVLPNGFPEAGAFYPQVRWTAHETNSTATISTDISDD